MYLISIRYFNGHFGLMDALYPSRKTHLTHQTDKLDSNSDFQAFVSAGQSPEIKLNLNAYNRICIVQVRTKIHFIKLDLDNDNLT